MKAKDKAWQLYSNYFDIVEGESQEGQLAQVHFKAINCALYCVDEAITNAPSDIADRCRWRGEPRIKATAIRALLDTLAP